MRRGIVRAALELIARDGWGGVSVRMIADACGIGASLVNYHFPSKDDLLRQAAIEALDDLLSPVIAVLESNPDLPALAEVLVSVATGFDIANRQLYLELLAASGRDDRLREEMARQLAAYRTSLSALLRARGDSEQRAQHNAAVIVAALDGLFIHGLIDPNLDVAGAIRAAFGVASDGEAIDG